jgi:uncharacterized protein YgbK (DUF1537 family)
MVEPVTGGDAQPATIAPPLSVVLTQAMSEAVEEIAVSTGETADEVVNRLLDATFRAGAGISHLIGAFRLLGNIADDGDDDDDGEGCR